MNGAGACVEFQILIMVKLNLDFAIAIVAYWSFFVDVDIPKRWRCPPR